MRRIDAALAAALLFAGPAFAADPVGSYAVDGSNPGGEGTYDGAAVVTRTGDTFRVVWTVAGDEFVGTGIGNDDFIAVSYKSGKDTGLALYSAQGGDWVGVWTYAGGIKVGKERWRRQ